MSGSVRTDDATTSNSTVVPGSEVWLTLTVSLPRGTARSASLSSTLSGYDLGVGLGGAAVVDWSVYDVQVPGSGGVTAGGSALTLSLAQSVSSLSVSEAGVVLSLGEVVNSVSGGTGGVGSPVVFVFRGWMRDAVPVARGVTFGAGGNWSSSAQPLVRADVAGITVVEPAVSDFGFALAPVVGDAGDILNLSVTVSHAAASDAVLHHVRVQDAAACRHCFTAWLWASLISASHVRRWLSRIPV